MADDGEATKKDENAALAADGEEDALLGLAGEEDDDVPRPEGGLHALGQLGTAVVIVAALVVVFLIVAGALGFVFH
jgi:hypothetical protein